MSATGFVLGQTPDNTWSLHLVGNPQEARNEFKRIIEAKGSGFVDVLVFDTYGGPQPRKRRRFPKNAVVEEIPAAEPEPEEVEEAPQEVAEEPYTGPDEETPAPQETPSRSKRKKGK